MKTIAISLLACALGGSALAEIRDAVPASLNAVRAQPSAYLNSEIEFEGRFARTSEVYQPFYTMFDSFSYENFTAWDAANDLGDKAQYLDSCPTLYVHRKMGEAVEEMNKLLPHQRFKAHAVVRSVFGGHAFIEVVRLERLDCDWCIDCIWSAVKPHPEPKPVPAKPDEKAAKATESRCDGEPSVNPRTKKVPVAKS